jgi:hypothetical protein
MKTTLLFYACLGNSLLSAYIIFVDTCAYTFANTNEFGCVIGRG